MILHPAEMVLTLLSVRALAVLAIILSSSLEIWVACGKEGGLVTFIFGDSLNDPGNNNYIDTLSKANYPPNGIDFGNPTGRFTNGRTIADIVGQELGAQDFTPPYLAPNTTGPVILQGVNYASGAGGILNQTGQTFGGRLSMDVQIDYFAKTKDDIVAMIGPAQAQKLMEKAIFSASIGANDIINNYLTPIVSIPEQQLIPPEVFRLYDLGARKIVVVNVGTLGCIPYQRDVTPAAGDECVSFTNELTQSFNSKLRTVVKELGGVLVGAQLVIADAYKIINDIINRYDSYGFENSNAACCHVAGPHGGLIPCGPLSTVCDDRSKYVFWDPFHPSEAANVIIAKRFLDGDLNDISPMNIRQLAAIPPSSTSSSVRVKSTTV
ncbi:GDSL esterase/lipase At4g16230 [Linum grandiflorum]